ncbi:Zn-finger in Ran binding protein and others domain-containing protein [Geopyxis carbonaria]|nr:Zn-finger in Ran binding protein and others domain-containing protein [Geopyxis carbonaria]
MGPGAPSSSPNRLIDSYTHLTDKPASAAALTLLRKVASLVKPIMLARGYHVGTLGEFFPAQTNLLGININGGQKILLRLRPHYDAGRFLPEAAVVHTMLHELTHNVHGPHDERFYKLLGELTAEYEKLRASGYSGEGFYSDGKRLGGRRVPAAEARHRAALAAQRRLQMGNGGGRRLGGVQPAPRPGPTMRERLAAAAERRARDQQTCGATQDTGRIEREAGREQGTRTTAEDDDAADREYMEAALAQIAEMEKQERGWREVDGVVWIDDDDDDAMVAAVEAVEAGMAAEAGARGWDCGVCTLINQEPALQCGACGAVRGEHTVPTAVNRPPPPPPPPPPRSSTWECHQCGLHNDEQWWTCEVCGVMKLSS